MEIDKGNPPTLTLLVHEQGTVWAVALESMATAAATTNMAIFIEANCGRIGGACDLVCDLVYGAKQHMHG